MELLEYKMLLEQYYDGNTSIDEERKLKSFLSTYVGDDLELLEAKAYFDFSTNLKKETVDIDFDSIVKDKPVYSLRKFFSIASAVAAVFVIGLLITSVMKKDQDAIVYAYVNGQAITNKQEAILYSQQALQSISTNLNKGTQNLSYINKLNEPVHLITTTKN